MGRSFFEGKKKHIFQIFGDDFVLFSVVIY